MYYRVIQNYLKKSKSDPAYTNPSNRIAQTCDISIIYFQSLVSFNKILNHQHIYLFIVRKDHKEENLSGYKI